MGLAWDELDCVVLGDEPGGLWLLREWQSVLGSLDGVGWISLEDIAEPVLFPALFAPQFGIPLSPPEPVGLLTPYRSFAWEPVALKALFPELPLDPLEGMSPELDPLPSTAQASAIRYAIRRHPELIAFAQGIWKVAGRARSLSPERLVTEVLRLTSFGRWDVRAEVPESVLQRRVHVRPRQNNLNEVKVLKNGSLSFAFEGMEPIAARRWVLNLPWYRLFELSRSCPQLLKHLNAPDDVRSRLARVAWCAELGTAVLPNALSRLTLYFETEVIPDPDGEIWPFEISPQASGVAFKLWANVPCDLPLDATLEAFRRGLKALHRPFPFLRNLGWHRGIPLEMDSCFSEESRAAALEALERTLRESYEYSTLHTQTRLKNLYCLFPSHHCHLPYPLGPLKAARTLLEQWMAKKTRKSRSLPLPKPSASASSRPG